MSIKKANYPEMRQNVQTQSEMGIQPFKQDSVRFDTSAFDLVLKGNHIGSERKKKRFLEQCHIV